MNLTKDELNALDALLVTAIYALDHSDGDENVAINIEWMDLTELQSAHDKIYSKINY
jgi:hypothetical protein